MVSYSTNWMGPVSLEWFRKRGLLEEGSSIPTTNYSGGRIDIHGVPEERWGLEYHLPVMHDEDWYALSDYLHNMTTEELLSYNALIEQFETHYGKRIRWADGESIEEPCKKQSNDNKGNKNGE